MLIFYQIINFSLSYFNLDKISKIEIIEIIE